MSTLLPPLARRWTLVPSPPRERVDRLRRELALPEPLCRLLAQRGHGDPDAARSFLRPHAGQIGDPGALAGIGDAVARLRRAIRDGEPVLVHGDYDVDGVCATALYVRALEMMGARVIPFVPHRTRDGYDLSAAGVDAARAAGATLILTADCGIVAHAAVDAARVAGIDVVVTDHHTSAATLPAAVAVVNPNRPDCVYPEKGLCGTGVAYKVCCALAADLGVPEERLHALLDLVAVATIADVMPLAGENRALVRWGLRVLAQTPNPGLRALLVATGLEGHAELSAAQVGYILAPRINAVGRMGAAMRGVRLLLTGDPGEAREIAATLETENRRRQSVEADTLREALDALERDYDAERDRGVVLAGDGWNPGVIGIVAARVVERIHRPAVLIALDGAGDGKGSARSIPGFDLYAAMRSCSALLSRFGGHRYAAGCSLPRANVEPFRAAFDAHAADVLSDELLVPEVRIDLEIGLADATTDTVRMLRHAGPFGAGNPTPVFVARGVRLAAPPRVVGRNHLKLMLTDEGATLEAIGWGMGDRLGAHAPADAPLDVAFKLDENRWNGRTEVQAKLVDLRPA